MNQIERLEDVDKTFLRQLFNAHAKTGLEFLYSESGAVPIRIKISVRRLLYWHHLLTVDESEMIQKVYLAQKLSPVSGDWILLLEEDKKQFGIKLSDKDVASLSKQKFRNYLLKKATQLTVKYLKKLKGGKSKSIHLDVSDTTICTYLIDGRFSREERELLFRLRSRTINVKSNFPNAFLNNNMLCEICKIFPCTQSHLLQCPALTTKLIVDSTVKLKDSFVYGNVEQQLLYVKIYAEFWKLREEVLKERKKQENVTTL